LAHDGHSSILRQLLVSPDHCHRPICRQIGIKCEQQTVKISNAFGPSRPNEGRGYFEDGERGRDKEIVTVKEGDRFTMSVLVVKVRPGEYG